MIQPPTPTTRGPKCPPAFALEAVSAGEPASAEVSAHLSRCEACRSHVAALEQEREAYAAARPAEQFLRKLERREAEAPKRASRFRLAWALPVALALLIAPFALRQGAPAVLLKGDAFRVVRLHPGAESPEPLATGSRVTPGDALRFAYEAPEAGFLLVLELDGTGKASVFQPFGAARAQPVAAGERAFLEGSVVLDEAPGPEWLVAVYSRKAFEAAPLLRQLEAQAGGERLKLECGDCRVSVVQLIKEVR